LHKILQRTIAERLNNCISNWVAYILLWFQPKWYLHPVAQ